jgi:NAD-dependent SIR2 family protein deacetylase
LHLGQCIILAACTELIYGGLVPTCEEPTCQEWIKPDIVFFGEGLPDRFGQLVKEVGVGVGVGVLHRRLLAVA